MTRWLKLGVALLVVLGLLFFLQSRAAEQPMTQKSQPVDLDALAK